MPLIQDIYREISHQNISYFTNHIINASLLFAIRLSSKHLQLFIMEKASYKIMLDIRLAMYTIMHYLPTHQYTEQKHGDITSRILNDTDKLRTVICLNFDSFIPNVLTFIGTIGYLFYLSWQLTVVGLIGIPVFIITLNYFSKRLRKVSKQLQKNTAYLTQMIQESLLNMPIIKIYTSENSNISRFNQIQHRYLTGYLKEIKIKIKREQIEAYSQYILFLMIIWLGGYLSFKGYLPKHQLIAYFSGVILLVDPVVILSKVYAATFQVTASIDRIRDILRQPMPLDIPTNTQFSVDSICLNDVSFRYPKTKTSVLSNVTFSLNKGDCIGLVGPSGAGKSTLIYLLCKFFEPTGGEITIDGIPSQAISTEQLRRSIAYVPQESLLFRGTILDNCRMGNPDASIDDVVHALTLANAWEFVRDLPHQLMTKIGTQGLRLSGGQRQRLSIARAIVRKPRLLILDEATSALDANSEEKVQEAIHALTGTFTMLVISHRLSTLKNATRIVVLSQGTVHNIGTHNTLIDTCPLYRDFVHKQSILSPKSQ